MGLKEKVEKVEKVQTEKAEKARICIHCVVMLAVVFDVQIETRNWSEQAGWVYKVVVFQGPSMSNLCFFQSVVDM